VAFPGCQLVAEVRLVPVEQNASFYVEVLQGVRVTRTSATVLTAADLATLSCPSECSGEAGSGNQGVVDLGGAVPTDAGVDGGSSLPSSQGMPGTLAIDVENNVGRMIVGDLAAETLWIVPLVPGAPTLGAPRALTLEKGANGVSVVRVSPRSQAGKFLYAVARDASVRVVDLDREVECETNPDPRTPFLLSQPIDDSLIPLDPSLEARQLGCFPLGDPSTPARNPAVTTPGITLQGNALPKDVTFVHLEVPPPPTDVTVAPAAAGPSLVVGDFAWIVGSEGRATLVNIFDGCPAPNVQQNPTGPFTPMCQLQNMDFSWKFAQGFPGHPTPNRFDRVAHRLRPGANRLGQAPINCTDNGGAPRISDESPGNNFTVTVNGTAAGAPTDGGMTQQISLYQEQLTLDPVAQPTCSSSTARSIAVYDPDHVRNETWDVTWEGVVPGSTRSTARLGTDPNSPDVVNDPGGSWCSRGIRAGDKLWLNGCTKDDDCDFAQTCTRDPAQPPDVPNGLCLDRMTKNNQAPVDPRVATDCSILLRSMKHYRIQQARMGAPLPATGETSDWLRLRQIYEPEHFVDTRECNVDADCAMVTINGPKDTNGAVTLLPTKCLPDDFDGKNRCLRACDPAATDVMASGCGTDFLCIGPNQATLPAGEGGRCMRAPINQALFAECLNELQPYEIHAGETFIVSGSATGYFNDFEPDPVTRECVVPPVSSPFVRLHQGRIPIGAADLSWCPALSNPLDALPATAPNVCLDQRSVMAPTACTTNADCNKDMNGMPTDLDRECIPRSDAPGGFCLGRTATRSIHYENVFYAIELNVPARSLSGQERPIMMSPQDATDLKFILVGGGFPLATALGVDAQAQQPKVVVTSPDRQTIFVVDEGKSSAATGLRGQLLRVSTAVQATDRTFQVR
jgi:hypothetical protein